MMNNFAILISDRAGNLVSIRGPIGRFGEVQFTANALVVGDDEIAVLVDPTLATEQIVNARGHLIPTIMISVFR